LDKFLIEILLPNYLYKLTRVLSIKGVIFVTVALLAGCSSVKTPVGPICVSCKPYYCRNMWHYPQKYYEYDAIGLASWYGNDFQGKSKATGEPFNKNAFTAAHRTLPIPSIVRVTSLTTGRSIIVLVDDRGPFTYTGRIIDLSYGAARALNIHRPKPSMVRVECLVGESLKLSRYIASHCRRKRDIYGRSWIQLYYQEIARTHPIIYSSRPLNMYVPRKPMYNNTMGKQKKRKYNGIEKILDLNRI
jgi:hypothetical protein